jgi:hypothetical protein
MRVLLAAGAVDPRISIDPIWLQVGRELLIRDHRLVIYCVGLPSSVVAEIRGTSALVVHDLERMAEPPDVVHGLQHIATLTALLFFSDVPAVCSVPPGLLWESLPRPFPRLYRYLVASTSEAERLVHEYQLPPPSIGVLPISANAASGDTAHGPAGVTQLVDQLVRLYGAVVDEHRARTNRACAAAERVATAEYIRHAGGYLKGEASEFTDLTQRFRAAEARANSLAATLGSLDELVSTREAEIRCAETRIRELELELADAHDRLRVLPEASTSLQHEVEQWGERLDRLERERAPS